MYESNTQCNLRLDNDRQRGKDFAHHIPLPLHDDFLQSSKRPASAIFKPDIDGIKDDRIDLGHGFPFSLYDGSLQPAKLPARGSSTHKSSLFHNRCAKASNLQLQPCTK